MAEHEQMDERYSEEEAREEAQKIQKEVEKSGNIISVGLAEKKIERDLRQEKKENEEHKECQWCGRESTTSFYVVLPEGIEEHPLCHEDSKKFSEWLPISGRNGALVVTSRSEAKESYELMQELAKLNPTAAAMRALEENISTRLLSLEALNEFRELLKLGIDRLSK